MRLYRFFALAALLMKAAAADPGYYRPDALPVSLSPMHFANAQKSVLKLTEPQDKVNFGSCSAFLVSNSGYALTALHCLTKCALESGAAKVSGGAVLTENQTPASLHCNLKNEDGYEISARVVVLGQGYLKGAFASIDRSVRARLGVAELHKRFEQDYAVIKLEKKSDHCLTLTTAEPAENERLWAVSFPAKQERAKGLSSDGRSKYASTGVVLIRDPDDAPEMRYSDARIVHSTLDLARGSSGSPAMNFQGEFVGVNAKIIGSRPGHAPLLSHSVRATFIAAEVTRLLGEATAARVFDCQPKL